MTNAGAASKKIFASNDNRYRMSQLSFSSLRNGSDSDDNTKAARRGKMNRDFDFMQMGTETTIREP